MRSTWTGENQVVAARSEDALDELEHYLRGSTILDVAHFERHGAHRSFRLILEGGVGVLAKPAHTIGEGDPRYPVVERLWPRSMSRQASRSERSLSARISRETTGDLIADRPLREQSRRLKPAEPNRRGIACVRGRPVPSLREKANEQHQREPLQRGTSDATSALQT